MIEIHDISDGGQANEGYHDEEEVQGERRPQPRRVQVCVLVVATSEQPVILEFLVQVDDPSVEEPAGGCLDGLITFLMVLLIVLTLPVSVWIVIKQVQVLSAQLSKLDDTTDRHGRDLLLLQEYERAVIFRLGRLKRDRLAARGPGLFFVIPCLDDITVVDLRTVAFCVPPQEVLELAVAAVLHHSALPQVLSRDSVTVRVDAVVYYHVQVGVDEGACEHEHVCVRAIENDMRDRIQPHHLAGFCVLEAIGSSGAVTWHRWANFGTVSTT